MCQIKAVDLRSKANLPSSGSASAEEAVQRSQAAASQVLEMKYPNSGISDQMISRTCLMEIKYSCFLRDSLVTKSRNLDNLEVRAYCILALLLTKMFILSRLFPCCGDAGTKNNP